MKSGTIPYDLASLKEIDAADPGAMAQIVKIFLEKTPEVLAKIDKAVALSDGEDLAFQAHLLKASIELFNIASLKGVIRQIEKTGKTGDGREQLSDAVNMLKNKMNEVIAGLRQEFS